MTAIDIPFRTGSIIVLSDLHHDHYARRKLEPFAAHGSHQSLRWTADALILAGERVMTAPDHTGRRIRLATISVQMAQKQRL